MVKLDGNSWITVDSGSSYTFNDVVNGKHTVKVQAFDNAGNIREASVRFTVKM
jgi:hypothetical protein